MTAPDAPAPPSAAAPRRRPAFVIGAVLWVGVFAALAAVFVLRGDRTETGDEPLVVADRGEGGVLLKPVGETKLAPAPKPLPAFELPERRGGTVTREAFEGKVSVVGFIFTRCASTCPRVSKSMMEQRKKMKDAGVQFVSLSVDPEYDTPAILTKYADFYGAQDDAGWLWLTGDRAKVYDLIQNGFEQAVGEDEKIKDPGLRIYHTNNLMLVGPDATVRGKYNALIPGEMAKLKKDAADLVAELPAAADDGVADDRAADGGAAS